MDTPRRNCACSFELTMSVSAVAVTESAIADTGWLLSRAHRLLRQLRREPQTPYTVDRFGLRSRAAQFRA